MSKENLTDDDVVFCFSPNPEPWFWPVILVFCSSLILVGFLILDNPFGSICIGFGLLILALFWNDQLKNRSRSVSYDGKTIRVQDSKHQVREVAIDDVSMVEPGEDSLLIRFEPGRFWEVGFGWLSDTQKNQIATLINKEISRR